MARRFHWKDYPRDEPRLERWFHDLRPDLRLALRRIRREPGLTALIVATLAIGIGANATMVGAIDRLLLRAPPHIDRPDRVTRVVMHTRTPEGVGRSGPYMSYPAFLNLEADITDFEAVAGFTSRTLPLGEGVDAPRIEARAVTPSYFRAFGVRPILGRFFGPDDGFPLTGGTGGPPLAVLGHGFWQQHFGGDHAVIGRAMSAGTVSYTIVGIAPAGFRGVASDEPDVWLPITVVIPASKQPLALSDQGAAAVAVVARLRPIVSREKVEEQATAAWRARNVRNPSIEGETHLLLEPVIPGRGIDKPHEVKVAIWLGGLSVLVLLIACANVTNLLLARAFTRRREIAVRLSIGASTGRLARQMLTESLLLTAIGAAGAVLLAAIGGRVLEAMFVNAFPSTDGAFVDARLFAFTAALALGTGVLVSLVPLIQSRAPDLTNALKASPSVGGGRTSRIRMMLLVTQSAFCLVLLVVAALFAQSLRRVEGLDLGVDLERTIVAHFDMRSLAVPVSELNTNYSDIVARARAIPGVTRAALGVDDPFMGSGHAVAIHTPARSRDVLSWSKREPPYAPMMVTVDSGFFRTVRARLRGRDFESRDVRGAERVVIINQPVAEFLFPGEEPLGQCVYLPIRASAPSEDCATVIGVLQGYWYRTITDRNNLVVYIAAAQRPWVIGRPGVLFVHSTGDPAATMRSMREAILSVRPDLPWVRIQRLIDVADPQLKPWRLAATMFSIFGAVALVIAVVGLYAVVSFAATQRANEIAVRLALGARARDILLTVGTNGMSSLVVGLAIGAIGAVAIRSSLGPLLFQTSPDDPMVIGAVAALLLGVGVVAILVPTVQALGQNPARVLRSE